VQNSKIHSSLQDFFQIKSVFFNCKSLGDQGQGTVAEAKEKDHVKEDKSEASSW